MANEVKHTPGPWKAEKDERNGVWYVCANPAERMADMLSESNARLIAAAPELLAACKYVYDEWLKLGASEPLSHAAIRQIADAIRAAEGEEAGR